MFCMNCGKELPEGAVFCPACGTTVDDESSTPTEPIAQQGRHDTARLEPVDTTQQLTPQPETPRAAATSQSGQPFYVAYAATPSVPPKKHAGRTVAIIVACIVVVAGIGIGVYLHNQSSDDKDTALTAQASYSKSHPMHAVVFTVFAPGYDDSTCSKIPLHVTGTDMDGTAIDESVYIGSDGRGLSLTKGSYTVTVPASPLLANGTIYDTPTRVWTVTIGDDVTDGVDVAVPADLPLEFTVTDPASVTDDQLDAAYNQAIASGMNSDTASKLKTAISDARKAALDKQAADAVSAAAAAEEAKKAHIDLSDATTYYNVNIFLSNFAETGFLTEGAFNVADGDNERMTLFAYDHIFLNDKEWAEYSSGSSWFADSAAKHDLDSDVRVTRDHLQWAVQKYFGQTITLANPYGGKSDDTYLYFTETGGHTPSCGIALSTGVEDLGNNQFAVTCRTFTGISQSASGDGVFGWSISQAESADASASYHIGKNGTYRCVLQANRDGDTTSYTLISSTPV